MPANESTMKFKADISELRAAMQEAGRQIRLANSEFKAATAGMDNWSKSSDGLTAKIKQLNTILGAQKSQLSSLEAQYEAVAGEYGENSKGAEELRIKINNQMAAIGKTEKELRNYEASLEESAESTDDLGEALQESEKDTKKATEGFTVMKGALADLVASGIKAAINGLKQMGQAAIDAYQEFDEGEDNLIKATGAVGEQAEELGKSYKNVAKSVKGDMGEIGSAMGEVNTRFGFTGDALEGATEKFIKFSEITGTDATKAVQLVSRAMGDAGIDITEYEGLLDDLAKASQASGISVDTLAESLTKYGAPMRALGFDVKESIALFSQWEKAGVNTEIAFSGMKKAIGNWGKEGKDAREEFKKTLDEIAAAPDIADATAMAIEAFGTKAGPDLADAIQGGRFAYEDFLAVLEDSSGTVEATYEETQDGFDKMQLALQGARVEMGSFVGEILNKYEPQITKGIQSVTKGVEELITWAIGNKDEIIDTLKTAGTLLAGLFVTSKAVSFASAVSSIVAPLLNISKGAEGAAAATSILGSAMSALPLVAIAGLLVGLAGAAMQYQAAVKKAAQEEYGLSDAQKETIDAIGRMKDAYDQSRDAQDAANDAIAVEYGHIRDLKEEYNSLKDENGKVKEGYEDRANVILNELAEAMGVERSEIEKTIEQNGKLGDSLDELILKKQAEAALSANESAYTEAKKNQTEAAVNYQKAIENATEAEEKYKETQEALERAERNKAEAAKIDAGARADASRELVKAKAANDAARESFEKTSAAVEDAEEVYVGYNTTIQNYEGLSAAVVKGDSKAIQDAVNNTLNGLITAETGTRQTLEKQVKDYQEQYESMKSAVESGMAGVSQEQVDAAKEMVDKSIEELQRFGDESGELVDDGFGNFVVGAARVEQQVGKTAEKASSSFVGKLRSGLSPAKKSGSDLAKSVISGLSSKQSAAQSAGAGVAKAANTGANNQKKNFKKTGQDESNMFVAGIAALNSKSKSAGATLAKNAKSGAASVDAKGSGENFGKGFVNGIKNMIDEARDAAKKVAQAALSELKKIQKEGSPSKLTYQSGLYFTQGYINGIAALQGQLQGTVRSMVGGVVNELRKMSSYNFDIVADAASEYFVGTFERKTDYMLSRMAYENEQKIDDFDSTIDKLIAERDAKTEALQNSSDQRLEALDLILERELETIQAARDANSERGSTSLDTLKENYDASVDRQKAAYDNAIETAEANYNKKKDALNKKISNTKNKKRKANLKSELTTLKRNYDAEKKTLKDNNTATLAQLKKDYEAQVKATKDGTAKQEAALKTQQEALNKSYKDQIDAEKASAKNLISQTDATYQRLIDTQTNYKNAYQEASNALLSEYEDALSEYESKARELVDNTINGITDEYDAQYKDLTSKQNALINKFRSAADLFDISGAGVMTVNDITAQTENIRQYTLKLQQIKEKVSSELFDEIASFNMKEGGAYIDRLLDMNEADLAAYNAAYTEKLEAANRAADQIYGKDIQNVSAAYQDALEDAFDELPGQLEALGHEAMRGFVSGLTTNTDYMKDEVRIFIAGMIDQFKKNLQISSPSKVMFGLGEYTGEGFGDGLLHMIRYIRSAATSLADMVATPLDDVLGDVSDFRGSVPQTTGAMGGSSVTNNYNLVQNNTSPRSLSALETYQARRQQIALVKAFT